VLGFEEELRDAEVGETQLLGKMAAIVGARRTARVQFGMGRNTDAESTSCAEVFDEVDGVFVVARTYIGRVGRRVATESKDVLDRGRLVGVEDRIDVCSRVADACEVRHRRDLRFLAHPHDEVSRALARTATGTVGDRHECGVQALELGDRTTERQLGCIGLRGKELEGERAPRSEEIGDAGHLRAV